MYQITRHMVNKERPWIKTETFKGDFEIPPQLGERFIFKTNTEEIHTSEVIGISNELFTTRKDKDCPNISLWRIEKTDSPH